MFGGIGPSHQIHQGQQQIIPHGATNAAIGQCHRIAAVSGQQIAIHRQIAKIVDHHGKAQARVLSKQIIQQGGLAGAEETTNDRQRNGHGYPANRRPGQENTWPPKTVPQTGTSRRISGATTVGSSSRTAKSARLPTSILPTSLSIFIL